MELINGFWTDKNKNKWNSRNYSEQRAKLLCKTLSDCFDCEDCSECNKCKGCVNCSDCEKCGDCICCVHCDTCTKCSHLRSGYKQSNVTGDMLLKNF